MKAKRFTPQQIANILKEHENGKPVEELTRLYSVSRATFYKWRQRYSGMDASELKRIKELEEENRRLKMIYTELALDLKVAREVIEKKFKALPEERNCEEVCGQVFTGIGRAAIGQRP